MAEEDLLESGRLVLKPKPPNGEVGESKCLHSSLSVECEKTVRKRDKSSYLTASRLERTRS